MSGPVPGCAWPSVTAANNPSSSLSRLTADPVIRISTNEAKNSYGQGFGADALFLGVGVIFVKSPSLLLVSVQPPPARIRPVVLLSPSAGGPSA